MTPKSDIAIFITSFLEPELKQRGAFTNDVKMSLVAALTTWNKIEEQTASLTRKPKNKKGKSNA